MYFLIKKSQSAHIHMYMHNIKNYSQSSFSLIIIITWYFFIIYYCSYLIIIILSIFSQYPHYPQTFLFSVDLAKRGLVLTMPMNNRTLARVCMYTNVTKRAFAFNGEFLDSKRAFKQGVRDCEASGSWDADTPWISHKWIMRVYRDSVAPCLLSWRSCWFRPP